MFLDIIRMVVEATPPDWDDEALAKLEAFIDENPELAAMAVKIFFGMLRAKSND